MAQKYLWGTIIFDWKADFQRTYLNKTDEMDIWSFQFLFVSATIYLLQQNHFKFISNRLSPYDILPSKATNLMMSEQDESKWISISAYMARPHHQLIQSKWVSWSFLNAKNNKNKNQNRWDVFKSSYDDPASRPIDRFKYTHTSHNKWREQHPYFACPLKTYNDLYSYS